MTTGRINQVTIRSAKEPAPTHRREKLIPPTTHRRCPSHRISKILRNARAFAPALELFRSPMLNRMLVRQMQFVHGAARRLQPPIGGQQLNDPRPFRAAHLVFAFLGKRSSTGSRGALRFNDADLAQSYPALPLRDCDPLRSLNRFRRGHHTRDCRGGAFGARFDRPSFRLPLGSRFFRPPDPSHVGFIRTFAQGVTVQTLLRCWEVPSLSTAPTTIKIVVGAPEVTQSPVF